MKKILISLLLIFSVGFSQADYGRIDGAVIMQNYFDDFIQDNSFGTSTLGRIDGQLKFQNLFIDFLLWADSTEYCRQKTILFQDDFDFWSFIGYSNAWDVSSLLSGGGTNDLTSNISHITLTTDGSGSNETEGTRSNYAMVNRLRKNRSEFQFELDQITNTNYYMGWNDDGANAMVAASDKYVIVYYEVGTANWLIKVGDGSDEEVINTGVTVTTSVTVVEIWTETDGTIHLVIDDTTIDVSGFTNKMATAVHYLIVGQIETTNGAAVVAQIGYVENEKFKAH